MIERLENCPNCGAILDDTGRCNFCGSKVYDLFDIDISNDRGIKYIRIKTNKGMIIAPIMFNTLSMESHVSKLIGTEGYATPFSSIPGNIIRTEFIVVGNVIYEEGDKE